jgi:DUF1365 family protein|tara:strand:- start:3267 stop:4037 length:771 start_codon:yes stop_codon:yes gene_type:complete
MSLSLKNYIYNGVIRHRRYTPFEHFFSYPLFMVYVDISKVNKILETSLIWNINKPALISFYRKDYHGEPTKPLDKAVRDTIYKKTGKRINGPIRILTHLRYFGFCFNPVSFYYCFNTSDSKLEMIMAEVTNTPWNERYSYIIDKKMLSGSKKNLVAELEKKLHVSPFWGMDHQYEWLFSEPDESLLVNMKNFKSGMKVFDATLTMKRKALTIKNLLISVLRFPFITLLVVYRIHWQALKLWIKKAPFFPHPSKIKS